MKLILSKNSKLAITLFTALLMSCSSDDVKPVTVNDAVDKIITPYIVLGADVGIIVGVVKDKETTVYSYGEKVLGSNEKISSQSVLEIASLTKVYTSVALASMHINGELNLDEPIENLLPSEVHVPSFEGKKITLRHLATHTSGFPRNPTNMDEDAYNQYKGYTKEKMYDFINSFSLTRAPGSEVVYSSVGYGLLGEILSLKNNSNYERMIFERILGPLGMSHTTVSFTPAQLENLVQGYNGTTRVESWSQHMQDIMQGTGALISTLDDQLIYLKANMGLIDTPLRNAMLLSHDSKNNPVDKGLGWNIKNADGLTIIWKNGGNGGYGSMMAFDKTKGLGVVVMANSSMNPEIFPTDIGFEILKALSRF
ncbi:MAG: serine hydrolase domain-containing protein [Chryseolinea sp.]